MNQLLLQAKVRELIEESRAKTSMAFCDECTNEIWANVIVAETLEAKLIEFIQEQQREQRDGLSQLLAQAKQLTGVS